MSNKSIIKPYDSKIKTGGADSILASLFRNILFDLNISPTKFDNLLQHYLVYKNIANNSEAISSLRGNLKKELLKSNMSWKVFIKGLSFLNVKKFEITVKLYHSNNITSVHNKIVIIDTDINEDEE